MSWAPGTIVRCVDDRPNHANGWTEYRSRPLVVGELYSVRRSALPGYFPGEPNEAAVWIQEVVRTAHHPHPLAAIKYPDCHDLPFGASRFRLAEGGACEAERARAMKPQEIGK